MRYLDHPDESTVKAVSAIGASRDFVAFRQYLEASLEMIKNTLLWTAVTNDEVRRNQGAGAVLSDLLELFEDPGRWK